MKIRVKPGFLFYLVLLSQLGGGFLPALAAAALHELGHLAAIFALGGQVRALTLGFADVEMDTSLLPDRVALPAALAGPCVNLLCAATLGRRFPVFAAVSLLLGLYNLLPVYPLDGGRVVRILLGMARPLDAEALGAGVSLVVCGLVMGGAVWLWQTGAGVWPLLGAAALILRARREITVAFPGLCG